MRINENNLNERLIENCIRSEREKKEKRVYRLFLSLFAIAILMFLNNIKVSHGKGKFFCNYDLGFDLFSDINDNYKDNSFHSRILLIISSLAIDLLVSLTLIHWFIFSKNFNLIFTLSLFYSFRAALQYIFLMKFPNDYLFTDPGFPSLTVSYLHTSDFFFSGHTGLPFIYFLYFLKVKNYYLSFLSIFVLFIEVYMMLSLHGHYSIDILFGILFAGYFTRVVEKIKINII